MTLTNVSLLFSPLFCICRSQPQTASIGQEVRTSTSVPVQFSTSHRACWLPTPKPTYCQIHWHQPTTSIYRWRGISKLCTQMSQPHTELDILDLAAWCFQKQQVFEEIVPRYFEIARQCNADLFAIMQSFEMNSCSESVNQSFYIT